MGSVVSLRIRHPGLLYAEGLILTPVIGALSEAVARAAEHLIGPPLTQVDVNWAFVASYLLCVAGALAMKKPIAYGLVFMIPLMVGLSAAVRAVGWAPRTGPGIMFLLLASYLLCVAGALGIKKPLGHTIVLMLVPLVVIPLEVLLTGALLLWLFGFRSGIQ